MHIVRKLCVVCEGTTEAEFVKTCLAPHLSRKGLHAYSSILQARSGRHKGGRVTVERIGKHLANEYHHTDRITTLVDFYGFRDAGGRSREELEAAIMEEAEKWTRGTLDRRFVLPYVQMHEFEALLFTDIEQFKCVLDGWNENTRDALLDIRRDFPYPEDINDSPQTAPSKRLQAIFGGTYSKTEHGPLIAKAISLEKMRKTCPGFDAWIGKLEAWASA